MHDNQTIAWGETGHLEVLTFDLDDETFAVDAIQVREILDLLPETAVPGAAELVGSVVNFRGKIIPIADLRLAFGMPRGEATADSRIVVIELELAGEAVQIGIRTDKVHEVATLDERLSEDPPTVGLRWRRDYVRALFRRPDRVVVLPDLTAIFRCLVEGNETGSTFSSAIH